MNSYRYRLHMEAQELRAAGKHKIFYLKRKEHWVCVCGDLYVETEQEAQFHMDNPHMTSNPEDWDSQHTLE